tara:strand:- start:119 stop:607 length:489 start_codon:yes stop_codon:yes gene_type:complete
MKKRESKLWQRIRKNITKPHLIRVESNTINGIPDINGCWDGKEFWMELKSDKVGYPKLSKWQIAWINKRIKHGGIVIICDETLSERELKLYRPLSAITDARLLKPSFSFSFPVKWPAVQDAVWDLLQLVPEARSRSRDKEQRIGEEIERHLGSLTRQDLAGV